MSSIRRMLVLLAAAGALTAMLWPALIGRDILGFRDMLHNYGPMRELFWSGRISLWNDRSFGIEWPSVGELIINERDRTYPNFSL